jgi:hypothetical protein
MKKRQLLSIGTNAKTVKGNKLGFLTGVMYLAPSDLSGYQVCPMAKMARCEDPCLYRAGRGVFNSTQMARINKTKEFFNEQHAFMHTLVYSINALIRQAKKKGLTPLVRLNGTSDIRWENIRFEYMNKYLTIFEVFPDIQFYDYSKIVNRKDIPSNYDLTVSYSGAPGFQKYVQKAINAGERIAVVFRHQENIPESFLGMESIGGDDSDIRHIEPKNVVVALYAKGKAKKDTSGFVIDSPRRIIPIQLAA